MGVLEKQATLQWNQVHREMWAILALFIRIVLQIHLGAKIRPIDIIHSGTKLSKMKHWSSAILALQSFACASDTEQDRHLLQRKRASFP